MLIRLHATMVELTGSERKTLRMRGLLRRSQILARGLVKYDNGGCQNPMYIYEMIKKKLGIM